LTGRTYQSDRLGLILVSTYFLATPLGKIILVNQLNLSSLNMSSEIDPKKNIMLTLDEIPEEQRKAFEVHGQATEERRKAEEAWELQEFIACFKKERQGKVTQVKEAILPSTNDKAKIMPDVSTLPLSITPEDVSGMLNDHSKHMTNQLKYMLEDGLVKKIKTLSTSSNPYSVPGNPQASSSSALH
jgi:predicted HTH transcriptional regulator